MHAQMRKLSILGILSLILAGVIGPILFTGFTDLRSAQTELAEKKYDEAAHSFESAARRLLWRSDLWEQAGLAAYLGRQNEEAIRLLEIARNKRSLSSQGWNALGAAYWNNHNHQSAFAIWQEASRTYPSDVGLYDNLVLVYRENGDYTSEQNVLVKRLLLAPDANAHYQLG